IDQQGNSVNDAGWSSFLTKLTYKAAKAGRDLVKIDLRGTSQLCVIEAPNPKTLNQQCGRLRRACLMTRLLGSDYSDYSENTGYAGRFTCYPTRRSSFQLQYRDCHSPMHIKNIKA